MIHFSEVNYLAVLIATIITMFLGFLWYSPLLFGNTWAKLRNIQVKDMSGGGPATYILTALTALGGAFLLALLLTLSDTTSLASGLTVGLLIGLSISLKIGMNYLFENGKIQLYFITIGYHLVSYLVAGLIIGAMQA
ncbi:DUF1761 domain-containing protein [Paenibacillus sp. SYP-B3998]|uniref:DUF1761 domain-containing protein n=1 Tax=Paenibacillus sp. SYP-B3998 TaxID=2678564 RepID=A0A6G4A281_9BACL|nr:DUF1761 domain-containing protein [Paenibacillus sp. SYP-B3998]NEW07929.1 DUF1761 domain-containing protein [Paenibacillus sp. SYP-B3998]